jgi:hypothetical protein
VIVVSGVSGAARSRRAAAGCIHLARSRRRSYGEGEDNAQEDIMSMRTLIVASALAGLVGCGYPATQMEVVEPTPSQLESATPQHNPKHDPNHDSDAKAKQQLPGDNARSGAVSARAQVRAS